MREVTTDVGDERSSVGRSRAQARRAEDTVSSVQRWKYAHRSVN